jgi:predicted chitinase
VLPGLDSAVWLPALSGAFDKYKVSTRLQIAAAMGQFVAEAGPGFTDLRENTNYSASRLMQVFPNEIPDQATADRYAHDPVAIANLVYANRQGNGDVASGDGYRFRGGGLIQLTGRDEYAAFASAAGLGLDQVTAYITTAEGAAISGCWYLSTRGCLPLAAEWRLTDLTQVVNGGALQGLATRIDYANRFRQAFGAPIPELLETLGEAPAATQDLRRIRAALRP